jgi:hypothetical protein
MIALSLDTSVPAPCHKEARDDSPAGARASYIVKVVAWIKCRVVAILQVPRVGVTRANRGAVFIVRSLERLNFAHEGLKNEEARIASNTTTICASKNLLAALQRGDCVTLTKRQDYFARPRTLEMLFAISPTVSDRAVVPFCGFIHKTVQWPSLSSLDSGEWVHSCIPGRSPRTNAACCIRVADIAGVNGLRRCV